MSEGHVGQVPKQHFKFCAFGANCSLLSDRLSVYSVQGWKVQLKNEGLQLPDP